MAQHPFLQNLLNGQAVEWKPLGEVVNIKRGKRLVRSELEKAGEYAVYQNSLQPLGYYHQANCPSNSTFIITAGAAGEIGYSYTDFWAADDCYYLECPKDKLNDRFVFHALMNQKQKIVGQVRKASVPRLGRNSIENISIPIPPLSVQTKIVQILDAFTAITAELTAELAAELDMRNKQYQYYRDKLLSENELAKVGFEWKTLGEIAQYSKNRINANELDQDSYIGVDNLLQNRAGKTSSNHVPTDGRVASYQEDDILIGNIRPYLKKIWQANNNGGASGDVLIIQITDENINPRYLYQVLSDDKFFDYNMQHAKGAKMPRGNKDAILNYQIPIPPLAEQARIVAILDKFDTLTQSISDGLPREIELRQQQYAYYREALLSF